MVLNWKKWWEGFLENLGLGTDAGDKLDQAADKMRQEVELYKEVAAKSVALYRTRRRDLANSVEKHQKMEQAAITLQREGKVDAVNYLAVQLADSSAQIDSLTEEVNGLCATAQEQVGQFQIKQADASELLRNHGQLKTVQAMNSQLADLQKQMKSLTGSVTAQDGYKEIASQIVSKQNEFRAIAELESGDATQRVAVMSALKGVEASKMLAEIQAMAALPETSATIKLTPLDSAYSALERDPIRDLKSLPASTDSEVPSVKDKEGGRG